jgi:hypothetical protein
MSTRQFQKRLERVQKSLAPQSDNSCTFEELIQQIYRQDKKAFWRLQNATHSPLFLCIPGLRTPMPGDRQDPEDEDHGFRRTAQEKLTT